MKQSIVIAIAVLATNLLAGVFATPQQIVYADDSSETEINIKKRKLT